MNIIPLEGCTPEPLMNYLKALGVLKIIVEQEFDSSARGCWKEGIFSLRTSLTKEQVVEHFITRYKPSPILSPWNKAAGFTKAVGKDVTKIRNAGNSSDERFSRIKEAVAAVHEIPRPSAEDKDDLILKLRNQLPDDVIQWIDACSTYAGDKCQYSPFLGTGGNVGKMEISINYLDNINEVIHGKGNKSPAWLRSSLHASNEERNIKSSVSQFSPGRVGGANATQGTEGVSIINPWDFILMIEGSLFLTGATSRKLSTDRAAKSAFPFTVDASAVGNSKLAQSDIDLRKGKGEIWMPLWERPASLGELKILFAEGRAELKGRQARSGVDFARAVAGLGVDRGIKRFMRFSIVEFVKAGVMAAPLGHFEVSEKSNAALLREIDPWLATMKRACNDKAPARFRAALREIEQSIFDYCQHGDSDGTKTRFQRILIGLGKAEQIIATAPRFRANAIGLRPIGPLSSQWVAASDDSDPEFEIALALASLYHVEVGPMRLNLEDVSIRGTHVSWTERNHSAVWSSADLASNLAAILYRRVMNADKEGNSSNALKSNHRASLTTIAEFLAGNLDPSRIADLLWALSLCKTHEYHRHFAPHPGEEQPTVPAAYSLLKLLFHAHATESADSQGTPPRPDLSILGLLRADRTPEACQRTVRILRGKSIITKPFAMRGFPSRDSEWLDLASADCESTTLAAALLIPISHSSINALKKRIIRQTESPQSTTI